MNVLQISKVYQNGRISLGEITMKSLNLAKGEYIQIYMDPDGRICLAKVVPPEGA